jgi:hypothetical protein
MKFWLALVILFISLNLYALPDDSIANTHQEANYKPKLKILPNGYYRPETRIALGAFALITFKANRRDTISRWSFIKSTFVATQNKQLALENDWLIFFKKEKFSFYGTLDIMKFPEKFFGLGNNTNKDSSELYDLDRITHNSLVLKQINGFYFAGLNFDTQYLFGNYPNSQLTRYAYVNGSRGYFVNGLGPTFLFDSRDNGLISHTGWYNEVSVNFHGKATLSQFNFTNIILNSRKFIPVLKKNIWATEVYLNFNQGTLPFRSNPALGGFRFLRGYYTGRFRDKNLIVCQTELRIPIYWRIGAVVFVGMGEVAPDLKSFSMPGMKYTAGGGLRFLLSKKENANVRIDYGFTNEGGGFYMVFGESF